MKVIIVGGVAGGASAAARLRRLDERAEIMIFERSGYISYANCGLPYFIGGVIEEEGDLTLQTPESFYSRFRIDVRVRHEVTGIDRVAKTVTVRSLETGDEFTEHYDKLILAPGARPIRPNIPGVDSDRIRTLRTVEDTLSIHRLVEETALQSALVIGGGFIGLEMAENLLRRGLQVTLVEKAPQVLSALDRDMASFVHARLRQAGVHLLLNQSVTAFRTEGEDVITALADGGKIRAQLVLLALGVTPENTLARDAGLALGERGSIAVDAHMRTSDPNIYAVGDAVQVRHGVTGQETLIALAGPANKQGRIAADHICGLESEYRGSWGSSVIKIFDMTVAATGLNERAAKAACLDCGKVVLSPASHASYYPGGRPMTMKVLFDRGSLRLLGAQIVGYDGVDKRIDVLATAMQAGMTADRLKDLDLAYAPPFSSAKDPVNMAGFIIENVSRGLVKQFHYEDVAQLPRDGSVTLLDVRTSGEYAAGHAPGFIHIPVDSLRDRLSELDPAKPVYVMCQSALRSYIACRILSQHGFDCYNFSGGYRFYAANAAEELLAGPNTSCGAPVQ